jgi:hypothetical protein
MKAFDMKAFDMRVFDMSWIRCFHKPKERMNWIHKPKKER